MYNNWLTIGNITIHGYGVMIAIGVLMAFWLGEKQAKKYGFDPGHVDNLVFVCLIFGYICSKATYCIINWKQFVSDPLSVLGSNGWVVFGGIIGGIIAAAVYCHVKKINLMDYLNLLFPCVSLAQGFGRIGCFFAGCCYGKPTDSAFGVRFPEGSLAPAGVKLIPTQLIMSFGDFILFYILYRNYNQGKKEDTAALYMMLYSAGRFMVEFIRGDAERGFIGNLSTSQFIAIFMFAAGLILLVMNHRTTQKKESKAAA